MPLFVVDVKDDDSPNLIQLLMKHGHKNVTVVPSLWDHPELKYSAPPKEFLEKLLTTMGINGDMNFDEESNQIPASSSGTEINNMASNKNGHIDNPVESSHATDVLSIFANESMPDIKINLHDLITPPEDELRGLSDIDSHLPISLFAAATEFDADGNIVKKKKKKHAIDSPNVRRRIKRGVDFSCTMCSKTVVSSAKGTWNFLIHIQMAHSEIKPFKCPLCSFQHMRSLVKRHIEDFHRDVKSEPVDQRSPSLQNEWKERIKECFPAYFDEENS